MPKEWDRLCQLQSGLASGFCTAFLHQRTRPSGANRLVAVQIHELGLGAPWASPTSTGAAVSADQEIRLLELHAEVLSVSNGSLPLSSTPTYAAAIVLQANEKFSLLAGQPDPTDRTRFTIGYSVSGESGRIEGRLQDDDSVVLRVLDGPLILFHFGNRSFGGPSL
jgi:hypothetical protein